MRIGFIDWFNNLPYSKQYVAMGMVMILLGFVCLSLHSTEMYFLAGMVWFVSIFTFSMARMSYQDEKNEAINGVEDDE